MSASLLDGMTALITPHLVGKAASMLGESDTAIRKGVSGMFPPLLSGLASRSENPGFASLLFDLVRSPANDGGILDDVGSLFGANGSSPMMSLGHTLLGLLFGGGTATFANRLAGYAGIKNSTAMTLLNVAASLVLAFLGKRAHHDGLNASSLAALLHSEKHSYSAAVPSQLCNLGHYRGTSDTERATHIPPAPRRRASVLRWLLPAVAAIGGIVLLLPQTVAPIGTVYFDVDQSAPPTDAIASLSSVIKFLKANPGSTAVVSGYEDQTGNQAATEELAKHRAHPSKPAESR